jgi:RNase P subunit RPR2
VNCQRQHPIVHDRRYRYLEVKCLGCNTHQTVSLDIVRRPKTTPVHELERYMRCRQCSEARRYPYKRSHLVALRPTKISASDPPSTWWRASGEREGGRNGTRKKKLYRS